MCATASFGRTRLRGCRPRLRNGARVIIVRNQTQLTAQLMESAPNLIGIGRVGVGLDNIDMGAATKLGIVVVAPLNANATSVAELALGLVLSLARKIPMADVSTKGGGWDRRGCTGMEIEGKTLGLCGFGRIGAMVATRARAFGMKLVAYDPFLKADSPNLIASGATYCGKLEEMLASADFCFPPHAARARDEKNVQRKVVRRDEARQLFHQHFARRLDGRDRVDRRVAIATFGRRRPGRP